MKAVTSVAGSNIVAQMQARTSVEEGKLKVVLLHCLKLVLDGHSLRSSDCCSRSRNFYSKLFPDSKYADINCGRTKAGYIIKFALGSYCKELIISEMADKPFAIHVESRKADKALDRELQEAGKELAEAEIAFVQAKKRKQELKAMKSGVIARRDNVSDEIISSMFS